MKSSSFGVDLSVRQNDAVHASELLYRRIQDLEGSLVEKNMEVEQGKQREMQLHQTLNGFKELCASQERTIREMTAKQEEYRVVEEEARQRQLFLQHDAFQLSREVQRLRGELAATSSSAPLSSTNMLSVLSGRTSPYRNASMTLSPRAGSSVWPAGSSGSDEAILQNTSTTAETLSMEERYVRRINRLEVMLRHAEHEATDALTLLNHLIPMFQQTLQSHQKHNSIIGSSTSTSITSSSSSAVGGIASSPLNTNNNKGNGAAVDIAALIANYVSARRKREQMLNAAQSGGSGDLRLLSSPSLLTPTRS